MKYINNEIQLYTVCTYSIQHCTSSAAAFFCRAALTYIFVYSKGRGANKFISAARYYSFNRMH